MVLLLLLIYTGWPTTFTYVFLPKNEEFGNTFSNFIRKQVYEEHIPNYFEIHRFATKVVLLIAIVNTNL